MKILKKNTLYIYTDGSSLPKPRTGGIGIVFIYLDENEEEQSSNLEKYGYRGATNNQMELYACIQALKHTSENTFDINYNLIEVRTDSKYVQSNFNSARFYWPKQKWFDSYGKPILNAELWQQLVKLIPKQRAKVEIVWVKGHDKDEYNKEADKLARKSAQTAMNPPLSIVTVRRKKSKEKTKIGGIIHTDKEIGIGITTGEFLRTQKLYRYRYEVIDEENVNFGKVDFACSTICLKEAHKYLVIFNQNKKDPRIIELIGEIGQPKNPSPPYIKALGKT